VRLLQRATARTLGSMNTAEREPHEPQARGALFLFLFTNVPFLIGLATAWAVLWLVISFRGGDWTWFARSGSVLAIIGGVLSCRPVLRFTRAERVRIRNMTIVETFTPAEFEDQERDSGAIISGVVLLLAGTLIWAYGDLLPRLWHAA
jgi:hypothetical protein